MTALVQNVFPFTFSCLTTSPLFCRFGVGEFDWAEFTPLLKQKTYEEIKKYVTTLYFKFAHFVILWKVWKVCVTIKQVLS